MTESDRDKTIELMAEALCFVGRACDRNCPDVDHRPCPDALATWRGDAERALSHLQASGMAVVAGWQPIESAPKDGTRIILAWGGAAVTGSYLDNSHTSYPWKGWRVPSLELTPPGAPSAWMPFPEVPAHVS